MSKLAHSNEQTMTLIETRRLLEDGEIDVLTAATVLRDIELPESMIADAIGYDWPNVVEAWRRIEKRAKHNE